MNTILTNLDSDYLLDYITVSINYDMVRRNKLSLSRDITFGLELEFEYADLDNIFKEAKEKLDAKVITVKSLNTTYSCADWIFKPDGSLIDGYEVSSPILTDSPISWTDVETICLILKRYAREGGNAGSHVHIGSHILGKNKQKWFRFLKLWAVYENIIFRFCYGTNITYRYGIVKYAYPVSDMFMECVLNQNLNFNLKINKNPAIKIRGLSDSLENGSTIEFRCPNGTLDPVIWQNNVSLFAHLLMYAKSDCYDDSLIMNRYKKNSGLYNSLKWYNEIYLEQALELADMIYDNDLDKMYFLKQYLKGFKTTHNVNKSKVLINKKFK